MLMTRKQKHGFSAMCEQAPSRRTMLNYENPELDIYLNGLLANQWKLSRYYLEPDINTYNIRKARALINKYKNKIFKLCTMKKTNT